MQNTAWNAGGPGTSCGAVTDQRVAQAMTNRPLERLMEDPALTHGGELVQFGLEPPPRAERSTVPRSTRQARKAAP